MVELPPLIPCARCLTFFQCYLIVLPCTLFLGLYCPGTHGACRGVLWLPQWGSCTWTKYPLVHSPIQKSTIESTLVVSPSMPGIICVWQTCDGSSRVLFTLYLTRKLCADTTRCTGSCTGQPTNLRYQEGCHFATLQNSGILMGVGSSFFLSFAIVKQMHHC